MFYVIRNSYVGPNRSEHRDYYEIASRPYYINHAPRIEGVIGTYNDNSHYALGAFETIEDARKAIQSDNPEARENWDRSGIELDRDDMVVEVWPVADVFRGELLTVDWDDPNDNLEFTLAGRAVFLYSEGPEGREYHDAWRAAAEALTEDDACEFAEDSDNRAPIVECLKGRGWQIEQTAHDGWDCEWVVGRPPIISLQVAQGAASREGRAPSHDGEYATVYAWGGGWIATHNGGVMSTDDETTMQRIADQVSDYAVDRAGYFEHNTYGIRFFIRGCDGKLGEDEERDLYAIADALDVDQAGAEGAARQGAGDGWEVCTDAPGEATDLMRTAGWPVTW